MALAAAIAPSGALALPENFDQAIAALQAVGPEGQGNPDAATAWKTLSTAEGDALLPLLGAMETANPLARNWLRSAAETIAERELAAGKALPAADLGAFLLDTRQSPRARRLAFDLVARVDPDTASALVPGMLNDPSTELRRDAVQRLMDSAAELAGSEDRKNAAIILYRQALNAARDVDQIREIAKQLTEKLGQEIDLPRHFGFLMEWRVIAPFDNTGRAGFDTVFPPENGVDLDAAYPGKDGEVKWRELVGTDDYGMIDFNKPFGMLKEVTGYAHTEFNAARATPAELRLGCKNAWKIWLNGELVFGRDEYHRGARIDQYKLPVQLKEGKNTLLVKLCQNEQTQSWTVEWEFQLRVCDATGTAILAADRPETKKAETSRRRVGNP
ncbi:MAG: hypothetical protein H7A53_07910 [Akkermansiaceae bacterium]|nr:hypothetical protein [Akkermansiaceae bacterium]MCP5550798.1 hypothetical protein [Akkermansiaceae bacterium]